MYEREPASPEPLGRYGVDLGVFYRCPTNNGVKFCAFTVSSPLAVMVCFRDKQTL